MPRAYYGQLNESGIQYTGKSSKSFIYMQSNVLLHGQLKGPSNGLQRIVLDKSFDIILHLKVLVFLVYCGVWCS